MARQTTFLANVASPKTTEFMEFWSALNDVLRSHGQPDIFYGEARDRFDDFKQRRSLWGPDAD